jgi:hypothetical protein
MKYTPDNRHYYNDNEWIVIINLYIITSLFSSGLFYEAVSTSVEWWDDLWITIRKGIGRNKSLPNQDTILAFVWRDWIKLWKSHDSQCHGRDRTEHLSNKFLQRHRYSNLFGTIGYWYANENTWITKGWTSKSVENTIHTVLVGTRLGNQPFGRPKCRCQDKSWTPWLWSERELCRPSDRRLLAK